MARYLVNRDGACDYGDIGDPAEIDAYKVSESDNIKRKYQGSEPRTFKQFLDKMQGAKPKTGFLKMQANLGERAGETKF